MLQAILTVTDLACIYQLKHLKMLTLWHGQYYKMPHYSAACFAGGLTILLTALLFGYCASYLGNLVLTVCCWREILLGGWERAECHAVTWGNPTSWLAPAAVPAAQERLLMLHCCWFVLPDAVILQMQMHCLVPKSGIKSEPWVWHGQNCKMGV